MNGNAPLDRSPEPTAERAQQPSARGPLEVAVIGAGLSGLTCARTLADHGHRVRVVEKGRGPGGRMSTRRAEHRAFDHGAQYFTVRDRRFERWVEAWRQDGLVAPWDGKIVVLDDEGRRPSGSRTERFVGVPGMSAVCRHLATDLDVTLETRVERIERRSGRWRLASDQEVELGRFDAVVVSAPAAQTAELLADPAPGLASLAARAEMAPCWAAMVSLAAPLEAGFDAAFVHGSPLGWVARNGSKPGRSAEEAWVLHASPDWSQRHLELDEKSAAARLLGAFGTAIGRTVSEPVSLGAHRWRFALPTTPLAEPCLFDTQTRIGACGDWCGGPRVEGAFLSGRAMAGRLLGL